MKINIGIVGYGNLGKSVEQCVLSKKNLSLVAIFSRRTVVSKYNTHIEPYENILDYKNKIDIMILCGSSKDDLEWQSIQLIKHFDIINSFDNHKKIAKEFKKINLASKKSEHRAIICCGWDPGIFSLYRGLFQAISNSVSYTFWGKGISLGHSDAIRKIDNVDDGIEFTVPNPNAIKQIKSKFHTNSEEEPMHLRECFVVADSKHHKQIERDIKNIPNYFKGQPTTVNFISKEKLLQLKSKLNHRGVVFNNFKTSNGSFCKFEASVYMNSNPDFTASIIITYINAIINLKKKNQAGCFTCLDIPISDLYLNNDIDNLLKTIC